MGRRGPKPKGTQLKLLKGTRADRMTPAGARAVAGTVACPAHLGEIAREEWARIVPLLEESGVLTRVDASALAIYCSTYERWVMAKQRIAELESEGLETGAGLTEIAGQGSLKVSPYVTIATQAEAAMLRMLGEFGCTPAARARVSAVEKETVDPLVEFMARRKGS